MRVRFADDYSNEFDNFKLARSNRAFEITKLLNASGVDIKNLSYSAFASVKHRDKKDNKSVQIYFKVDKDDKKTQKSVLDLIGRLIYLDILIYCSYRQSLVSQQLLYVGYRYLIINFANFYKALLQVVDFLQLETIFSLAIARILRAKKSTPFAKTTGALSLVLSYLSATA